MNSSKDTKSTWDYLKHGKSCETCKHEGKDNYSHIRSEFVARCVGCIGMGMGVEKYPYWESKYKEDEE